MTEKLPFSDDGDMRTFAPDVDSEELKWHRDREDRIVTPVGKTDWMFQRDNMLPEPISGEIRIPAGEWHRVIKGTGELKVKIAKM